MVCRREQSKEMRKETSGALSPFLSSSSQVQTPPTLESEPGSNQRPHLALIRGLPLEVRERLYRNKGSVLWQTFPFQMAFVRQFSGVWLCAWHFGGKKKKTQRSEREDLLPQAAHDKQLYSQPALERDLPEV